MDIREVHEDEKAAWNAFVRNEYPPVGAFMQAWEWGEFQKALGRTIGRFLVVDGGETLAAFTLVRHALPLGLSYGYSARGPVIARSRMNDDGYIAVLEHIREWVKKNLDHLIFLRLEPPFMLPVRDIRRLGFYTLPYYVQPRHNTFVRLEGPESGILSSFHPSTRSNINRAQGRGVIVRERESIKKADIDAFLRMAKDTTKRNRGKNVYPTKSYFNALVATLPRAGAVPHRERLELSLRCAYHDGELAAAQFTVFFGDTATYLYGASRTDHLSSKAPTYLHWVEIQEARRKGFKHYDLGGIDEELWPTLTDFKRRFRGAELSYVGNMDILLQPKMYHAYKFLRTLLKSNQLLRPVGRLAH